MFKWHWYLYNLSSRFERRSVQLSGTFGGIVARKTEFAGAANQKKMTGNTSNNPDNAAKENHNPLLLLRMRNASRPVAAIVEGSSTPPICGGPQ